MPSGKYGARSDQGPAAKAFPGAGHGHNSAILGIDDATLDRHPHHTDRLAAAAGRRERGEQHETRAGHWSLSDQRYANVWFGGAPGAFFSRR